MSQCPNEKTKVAKNEPHFRLFRPGLEWSMECVLAVLERRWEAACEEVRRSSRCQREEQTKASVHVTWKVRHKSGLRKTQIRYFWPRFGMVDGACAGSQGQRWVPARKQVRRSNCCQREEQTNAPVHG